MSGVGIHRASERPYHVGFVMEQAMGHVTHHQALAAHVALDPGVQATWMPVPHVANDLLQRTPGIRNNLSLLLSMRARRRVKAGERAAGPFDALFYHTQLTALLAGGLTHRIPTILSLDATPLNVDPTPPAAPNEFVRRPNGAGAWDQLKFAWSRRTFQQAAGLVAWSDWVRRSLLEDYGVEPQRVTVIPPGVDLSVWRPQPEGAAAENAQRRLARKARLLFVGTDYDRKGGDVLLKAFNTRLAERAEMDVVSPHPEILPSPPHGVRVHRDLSINSVQLRGAYAQADVFVLPTLNDCTPLAVLEAMACGLPVVASDIGAIREQVEANVTGLLVPPGDSAALAQAVEALLEDEPRRRAMGRAGRARAERLFCAQRNYAQVLGVIKSCVEAFRAAQRDGRNVASRTARPGLMRRDNGAADLEGGHQAWASEH